MIATLTEIIGLPSDAGPAEIALTADRHSESLQIFAAEGDALARRELVELQFAYRVWAYADTGNGRQKTSPRNL